MDEEQWKTCKSFFKQKFPACQKCQGGHKTSEAMLVHLTASHFCAEAMAAFGNNKSCPMCDETLMPHKESFWQYSILAHMAKHLDQFVPDEETRTILKGTSKEENRENVEIKEETRSNNKKRKCSERKDTKVAVKKTTIKREPKTDCSPPKQVKVKFQFSKKSRDKPIVKRKQKLSLYQDCQEYFQQKYPSCQTCQKGFENPKDLKRHLSMIHFCKRAIRIFGKGNACSLCNDFSVESSKEKPKGLSERIKKFHAAKHLEQFIPDKQAKDLLLRAKSSVETQKVKTESELYNLARYKTTALRYAKSVVWQDCEGYFRNMFPTCKICIRGHACSKNMKTHMAFTHFSIEALTLFGQGNTCSICAKFSLKLGNSKLMQTKMIKNHMSSHLEHLIPDETARHLLMRARDEANNVKNEPKPYDNSDKIAQVHRCEVFFKKTFEFCHKCQIGEYNKPYYMVQHLFLIHYRNRITEDFSMTNGECNVCKRENVASAKALPNTFQAFVRHCMASHKQLMINSLDSIEAKTALTNAFKYLHFKFANRSLKKEKNEKEAVPAWHRCVIFFKQMFLNCAMCQKASYQRAVYLVQHLFTVHFSENILETFGPTGNNCQLCHEDNVTTSEANSARTRDIVRHFINKHRQFVIDSLESAEAREVLTEAFKRLHNRVPIETQSNGQPLSLKTSRFQTVPWHKCQAYFKLHFVHCNTCQKASYAHVFAMLEHIFHMHFPSKIFEAFGKRGRDCQACSMENVVPPMVYKNRKSTLIVRHFIRHHQQFLLDSLDTAEEREVVEKAFKKYYCTFNRNLTSSSTTGDQNHNSNPWEDEECHVEEGDLFDAKTI